MRVSLVLEALEERALLSTRVTELPIPAGSIRLEGITTGPDGNLWYTSFNNGKVGRVTPAGVVTEFDASSTSNSGPTGIAAGPDGNLWYALKNIGKIGRITPTGTVTEFAASASPASGPEGITAGPDGNVWFTQRFGNRIGRITPEGVLTEFPITSSNPSQPVGITLGPDGNVWFVEWASNKVGKITPTGQMTEYTLPTPLSGPWAIVTGPDGNLWFTEQDANKIGRIAWTGNGIDEFPLPTANSLPIGITGGPDGNVWFTEQNGGKIGRITPAGIITEFNIPTQNADPYAITFGPQRNLVFTQIGVTDNRLGLVSGVVDAAGGFIQALYRRALNRFAGPSELDSWSHVLSRTNTYVVANTIERAPEARMKLVKRWYVTHLGRLPGPLEDKGWVQMLLGGASEEQVLSAILGSGEYFNRTTQILGVRATATDSHFVRALFKQVLNREASDAEVANIRTNFLPKIGRQGVALLVLNSEEHRGNLVQAYYRYLLGRTNTPGTAEVRGWVHAKLDLTTIRIGFESSGEFYQNG